MIYIASDHAGYLLKEKLIGEFKFTDLGSNNNQSVDYPDFAKKLCGKIKLNDFGILICGSGQGMAMVANRHKHIRACVCWDVSSARLAKKHNNANVLCLGSRAVSEKQAKEIVQAFLSTDFEGGRHLKRLSKL